MPRPAATRPTDQELQILKVLWQSGPISVRDVWKTLSQARDIGYTSVLKIMQIMKGKGIVLCDTRQRPQLYRAKQPQQTTLRHLANDLLHRAFGGSAKSLMLHALDNKRCSPEELAEIRNLLDQLEKK